MKRLILPIVAAVTVSACSTQKPDETIALKEYFGGHMPNYQSFFHDLNNDDKDDLIVYLSDRDYCGSAGCTMLVFANTGTSYDFVSRSTIVNPPIKVSKTTNEGWNSLLVSARGKGMVALDYTGEKYPLNPSMQRGATKSEISSATMVFKELRYDR